MRTEYVRTSGVFELFAAFCLFATVILLLLGVLSTSSTFRDVVYKFNNTRDYHASPLTLNFAETPTHFAYNFYSTVDTCAGSELQEFQECIGQYCQQAKISFQRASFLLQADRPNCYFDGYIRFFEGGQLLI